MAFPANAGIQCRWALPNLVPRHHPGCHPESVARKDCLRRAGGSMSRDELSPRTAARLCGNDRVIEMGGRSGGRQRRWAPAFAGARHCEGDVGCPSFTSVFPTNAGIQCRLLQAPPKPSPTSVCHPDERSEEGSTCGVLVARCRAARLGPRTGFAMCGNDRRGSRASVSAESSN